MTLVLLRRMAWISGILALAGIIALVIDWGIAARRTSKYDKAVQALQEQVKQDAAIAPRLQAEQEHNTVSRLARRRRGRAIGWALIICSALFLTSVKSLVASGKSKEFSKQTIAAAETPSERPKRKKRKRPAPPAPQDAAVLDLSFVDQAVAQHGRPKEAAIPLLQAMQQHYRYLPEAALQRLCEITEIRPAEIAGTASFYGRFRSSPVGRHMVRVCHGTACHVAGARQITEELRRRLKIPEGADTDAAGAFTIEEVACLGCCSLAPVLMVDEHTSGRLTASSAVVALEDAEQVET